MINNDSAACESIPIKLHGNDSQALNDIQILLHMGRRIITYLKFLAVSIQVSRSLAHWALA